jgi:AcrR family transcriptional regulator
MSGPHGQTRLRILEVAQRNVMQRGYHAFSYNHISRELGVKNAAIHYHFRTKTGLVCAVLQQYTRQFRRWSAALIDRSAVERLEAYLELSRIFIRTDCICCLGMMSSEFNVLPIQVQAETDSLYDEILVWIAGFLAEGRANGTLDFQGTPRDSAAQLACTLLGAQQLGRVRGLAAFEPIAKQIRLGFGLAI